MKRKAIVPIGTAAVLACILAGCSTTPASPDAAVELELWTFKQSHVAALDAVAKQCFPKGDVTVKTQAITPDDAFTTKVQAAAQTKDLPDLLMAHASSEDWKFAQAGILTDLTDFYNDKLTGNFAEARTAAVTVTQEKIDAAGTDPATTLGNLEADHIYSVPLINGAASLIMANKEMLEAAGVSTDAPPATWEQWVADMTKVKAADPKNGGLVAGLQIPQVGYFWLYQPMAATYMGVDAHLGRGSEKQTPAWDSPESIETLNLWNQLTPLWADGVFNLGIDQADQAFAQGKAAYDLGGSFTVPFLLQQGMDLDNLLIFPAPAPEGSAISNGTLTTSPLVTTGITSSSKHPEEAKKFLECLSSVDGATTFMNESGDLASANVDDAKITSESLKALATAYDKEGATPINPPVSYATEPPTGDTVTVAATEVVKISAGETTPQKVADELTKLYRDSWAASAQ